MLVWLAAHQAARPVSLSNVWFGVKLAVLCVLEHADADARQPVSLPCLALPSPTTAPSSLCNTVLLQHRRINHLTNSSSTSSPTSLLSLVVALHHHRCSRRALPPVPRKQANTQPHWYVLPPGALASTRLHAHSAAAAPPAAAPVQTHHYYCLLYTSPSPRDS